MLSPARSRQAVTHVRALGYLERRICKALGISRNTVRYVPQRLDDEDALTADILRFAG